MSVAGSHLVERDLNIPHQNCDLLIYGPWYCKEPAVSVLVEEETGFEVIYLCEKHLRNGNPIDWG